MEDQETDYEIFCFKLLQEIDLDFTYSDIIDRKAFIKIVNFLKDEEKVKKAQFLIKNKAFL